jgi:hypothetical protein
MANIRIVPSVHGGLGTGRAFKRSLTMPAHECQAEAATDSVAISELAPDDHSHVSGIRVSPRSLIRGHLLGGPIVVLGATGDDDAIAVHDTERRQLPDCAFVDLYRYGPTVRVQEDARKNRLGLIAEGGTRRTCWPR